LREYVLVSSFAEAQHMSIGEVEEKYNLAQLLIMTRLQGYRHKEEKGSKNVVNKGKTAAEKNKAAWKLL